MRLITPVHMNLHQKTRKKIKIKKMATRKSLYGSKKPPKEMLWSIRKCKQWELSLIKKIVLKLNQLRESAINDRPSVLSELNMETNFLEANTIDLSYLLPLMVIALKIDLKVIIWVTMISTTMIMKCEIILEKCRRQIRRKERQN